MLITPYDVYVQIEPIRTPLNIMVFRTGPDREVGPWKPRTGMKIGFLNQKNWIFS